MKYMQLYYLYCDLVDHFLCSKLFYWASGRVVLRGVSHLVPRYWDLLYYALSATLLVKRTLTPRGGHIKTENRNTEPNRTGLTGLSIFFGVWLYS